MQFAAAAALHQRRKIYQHLYVQVLCAIAIGVLLGYFYPKVGAQMKPLGDMFIQAIKMVIAPLIFCTVVHGIASMTDMKKVGRIGLKAIVYFEVVTTLALVIGLIVANLWQPGAGLNVDPASIDAKSIQQYVAKAHEQSALDYVTHMIPATIVGAFAEGEILQVLFVSLLFAFALSLMASRRNRCCGLSTWSDAGYSVSSRSSCGRRRSALLARWRLRSANTVLARCCRSGTWWPVSISPVCSLFSSYWAALRISGFGIIKFLRYIKEELLIVLGTSSSESVMPRMIAKLENLGCHESVVGLVIPAGYSFNTDGSCVYVTMAAMFLAQATNTDLTLVQQLGIIGVLLLTSKGAAGVTGSGFIVLAATLGSVGTIPVASIVLILGVDRFMSEARALTNLIGNGVATVVVAKWEGALDEVRMRAQLDRETTHAADEPKEVLPVLEPLAP